jgi:hypothetical protein
MFFLGNDIEEFNGLAVKYTWGINRFNMARARRKARER